MRQVYRAIALSNHRSLNKRKEKPSMMKVTVLYGHPESPDEFEKYYESTHVPLAGKIEGVDRIELTKFVSAPDGGNPAFYRMAELYFATQAKMEQSLGSPEGQAAVADFENFAKGGVTVLIGSV
jgi:uncharacterized protein (TIGR02118 family)